LIIAIFILIAICVVLIYQLSQKKQVDDEIRQQNEQLKFRKKEIENDIKWLTEQAIEYNKQIDKQKQEIKEHIEQKNAMLEEDERMSEQAMKSYMQILDEKYIDIENEFDVKIAAKHLELQSTQDELDKLKATRAAAHEALLKEQEVKENKDNYRLLPSQADLADARRLEIVKRELNKPRILSMLIWKTYYQPIAQKQFPTILQAKTKMGIYKITNIITDECYIGQAVDIYKRWNDHCKCGLGIDTPPGNKLYKSMQEYGLENFTFELLTECKQSELNEKEKYFIELYQANIYGMNSTGGNR
jgi:hypothetical protein